MAARNPVPKNKTKSNNNLKPAEEPASQQQPASDSKNKPGRKSGCKPRGRKAARCRDPKPGVAGGKLRNAINAAVASQPDVIARALVKETIKGSVGSAKLLIDITGADKPGESKKKRRGPSLADELAMEEQWQGPPLVGPGVGAPFGPL